MLLTKPLFDISVWPKVHRTVQETAERFNFEHCTSEGFVLTFPPERAFDWVKTWLLNMFGDVPLREFDSRGSTSVYIEPTGITRLQNTYNQAMSIDIFRAEVLPEVLPVYPALVGALSNSTEVLIGPITRDESAGLLRAIEVAYPPMLWAAGEPPCGFDPGDRHYITAGRRLTRTDDLRGTPLALPTIEGSLTMAPNITSPINHPDIWPRVVAGVIDKGYDANDDHILIHLGGLMPSDRALLSWVSTLFDNPEEMLTSDTEHAGVLINGRGQYSAYSIDSLNARGGNRISVKEFNDLICEEIFSTPETALEGIECVVSYGDQERQMALRLIDRCRPGACWRADQYRMYLPPIGMTHLGLGESKLGLFIRGENGEDTLSWSNSESTIASESRSITVNKLLGRLETGTEKKKKHQPVKPFIEQSTPQTGVEYVCLAGVALDKVRGLFRWLGERGFVWQGDKEPLAEDSRHTKKDGILLDFDAKTAAYMVSIDGANNTYSSWRVRWEKEERFLPIGKKYLAAAVKEGREFRLNTGVTVNADTPDVALDLLSNYQTQKLVDMQEVTPWVISTGYRIDERFLQGKKLRAFVTDDFHSRISIQEDEPEEPLTYLRELFGGGRFTWVGRVVENAKWVEMTDASAMYPFTVGQTTNWKYADPVPAWVYEQIVKLARGE